MGVEAAVELAGHLLDEHARVTQLDGAQHGLELVPLDQLLGRLVRGRGRGRGRGRIRVTRVGVRDSTRDRASYEQAAWAPGAARR